jgi:hypothetical protein
MDIALEQAGIKGVDGILLDLACHHISLISQAGVSASTGMNLWI